MMKHELLLNYKSGFIKKKRLYIEYPLLWLWGWIYKYFFPRVNRMFVLLPDAELCFTRSNGQYKNLEAAENKIRAYKAAIESLSKRSFVYPIQIDKSMTVEDVGLIIIKKTNLET